MGAAGGGAKTPIRGWIRDSLRVELSVGSGVCGSANGGMASPHRTTPE